jgi:hypothetical protein
MKETIEILQSSLSIMEKAIYEMTVQKQELEERIKDVKRNENGL